jgi:ferritin heavy chain
MEWSSPLEALEGALDLEKRINESLLTVHKQAGDRHDAHLEDFLENQFLDHQVFSWGLQRDVVYLG